MANGKSTVLPEHVQCRAYGHAWDREVPSNVLENVQSLHGFYDVTRCIRCHTIRVDELDFSGFVVTRQYYYEDIYSNVTHLERRDARLWLYRHEGGRAAARRIAMAGRGDTPAAKQVKAKKASKRRAS